MKTLPLLALVLALAAGCSDDTLSTTPPPAVDLSGVWTGTWSEVPFEPLGNVRLVLFQGAGGAVEGTLEMTGLACVSFHQLAGAVTGRTFDGSVEEQSLRLELFLDGNQLFAVPPSLPGDFVLTTEDETCTVLEGRITLVEQVMPLIAGPPSEPFLAPAGSWRGAWLPEEGGASLPLSLELEIDAAGELHGLLDVEGASLPLLGAWTRERLTATAPGGAARISARIEGRGAPLLTGELALERAGARGPLVGRFRAVR